MLSTGANRNYFLANPLFTSSLMMWADLRRSIDVVIALPFTLTSKCFFPCFITSYGPSCGVCSGLLIVSLRMKTYCVLGRSSNTNVALILCVVPYVGHSGLMWFRNFSTNSKLVVLFDGVRNSPGSRILQPISSKSSGTSKRSQVADVRVLSTFLGYEGRSRSVLSGMTASASMRSLLTWISLVEVSRTL